jgi:hypothetical protein
VPCSVVITHDDMCVSTMFRSQLAAWAGVAGGRAAAGGGLTRAADP